MKHNARTGWYACGLCDYRRYWTLNSRMESFLRHRALRLVLDHHRAEHSGPGLVTSGPTLDD